MYKDIKSIWQSINVESSYLSYGFERTLSVVQCNSDKPYFSSQKL